MCVCLSVFVCVCVSVSTCLCVCVSLCVYVCVLEWRDPELMRDIEAATGEDLGSSRMYGKGRGKGKGKKKKKYPNLSDLKQSANTSRSRLEKKVFNKWVVSQLAASQTPEMMREKDKWKIVSWETTDTAYRCLNCPSRPVIQIDTEFVPWWMMGSFIYSCITSFIFLLVSLFQEFNAESHWSHEQNGQTETWEIFKPVQLCYQLTTALNYCSDFCMLDLYAILMSMYEIYFRIMFFYII